MGPWYGYGWPNQGWWNPTPTPNQNTTDPTAAPYLETNGASPLSWANPTQITLAVGDHTIAGQSIAFSGPLPTNEGPLLFAAEHAWEAVANVNFVNLVDAGSTNVSAADIRIGLGHLPMNFIGETTYTYDQTNHFQNATVLLSDDNQTTPLSDGDGRFVGYQSTVFQVLLHEIGHALGLAHNPDPTSIMNPTAGFSNPYITGQDAAALRSLYGAPSSSAVATALNDPVLLNLVPSSTVAV